MNILLKLAYDGSNYYGWQRQKDFITVQQVVEEALLSLTKKEVGVRGASRTDTGVHALAQGVFFKLDTSIPMESFPRALNSFLPKDVAVLEAREVSDIFHPQKSVIDKTYIYKIQNSDTRNPLLYRYTAYERRKLDTQSMKKACSFFLGEHDFSAFCSSEATVKSHVRTIYDMDVYLKEDIINIKIKGSGFLYNMVRIVAGTLLDVGLGKKEPENIRDIILSQKREKAGKTMIANGLTLVEVNYNE
ncbi:MAG: tRNA pseudouridine(38-40) synthase TruA [Firmicutes bacterium]|nr:tRNA pseudouridine(38-40) synthase TruA [Bacillota bacterium]